MADKFRIWLSKEVEDEDGDCHDICCPAPMGEYDSEEAMDTAFENLLDLAEVE